jgi:cell wall-associated NlpC family hydrolase
MGHRARSAVAAAIAAATVLAASIVTPVRADIEQEIAAAQSELSSLQRQAAAAAEQANDATLEWQQAQQAVTDKQAELTTTQQSVQVSQRALDEIVSQIYRNGGVDPSLLLLAEQTPTNWLVLLDVAQIVAGQQNTALVRTQVAEQQMVRDLADLEKAERQANRARERLLDSKATIDQRVAESTAVLSRLRAEQQRQIAEELARQQAQQRREADQAADVLRELPESTTKPVAEYAIRQVGKPYEAGSTGPDSFDASGLAKAAWAESDVDLPHSVRRQYAQTERVDITQVAPGDLVFIYGTDEHVGIYTGDGYFVHAQNPREGVVYEKLFTNEWMSEFAGAGRPRA